MSLLMAGEYPSVPSRGVQDFDSDDDECPIERYSYDFEVVGSGSSCLDSTQLLLVTNTKLSSDFANVYLHHQDVKEDDDVVGKIVETTTLIGETEEEGDVTRSKTRVIATVRKLQGGTGSASSSTTVCHCHFSAEPNPQHCNDVASMLFGRLSHPKLRVVVLTSSNLVQYQKPAGAYDIDRHEAAEEYVTRGLASRSWSEPLQCQRLEQPNMIGGGMAAAILTEREFAGKPCCLLANFTEVDTTDSLTLKGFHEAFFRLATDDVTPLPQQVSVARLKKLIEDADTGHIFM